MQVSQECLETRPKVSRESDPSGTDGRSCGSLVKALASARVDVPTALHFFAVRTKEPNTCSPRVYKFSFYRDAWICARQTTHRDPVSVQTRRKRKSKRERKQMQICNCRIFVDLRFFFLIKNSVSFFCDVFLLTEIVIVLIHIHNCNHFGPDGTY